jgi:hypothetical protein
MMGETIEKNVRAILSKGDGECFACERPIEMAAPAVMVVFKIDLLFTSKEVKKQAHALCADQFSELIRHRSAQARALARFEAHEGGG